MTHASFPQNLYLTFRTFLFTMVFVVVGWWLTPIIIITYCNGRAYLPYCTSPLFPIPRKIKPMKIWPFPFTGFLGHHHYRPYSTFPLLPTPFPSAHYYLFLHFWTPDSRRRYCTAVRSLSTLLRRGKWDDRRWGQADQKTPKSLNKKGSAARVWGRVRDNKVRCTHYITWLRLNQNNLPGAYIYFLPGIYLFGASPRAVK